MSLKAVSCVFLDYAPSMFQFRILIILAREVTKVAPRVSGGQLWWGYCGAGESRSGDCREIKYKGRRGAGGAGIRVGEGGKKRRDRA